MAACVAMALDYLGISAAYDRLLNLLHITNEGTLFSYVRQIETLGITVVYKQGDLAELHSHLLNNRPCIALVATGELPYWKTATYHTVVVIGLDDQNVYLNDPVADTGGIAVSRGDFDLAWLDRDEYYAAFLRRE